MRDLTPAHSEPQDCYMDPEPRLNGAWSDIAAYRSSRGPASRRTLYSSAFSYVAWNLWPRSRLARSADGDVFVGVGTDEIAAIVLVAGDEFNALADKFRGTFVVHVEHDVCRVLFELAADLWTNPSVCADVGDVSALPAVPMADAVLPRGLEYLWALERDHGVKAAHGTPSEPPAWLVPSLSALCARRRLAFELTVSRGLQLLLLHEFGHILLHHLELNHSQTNRFGISEAPRRSPMLLHDASAGLPSAVARGLEIFADRFALQALFQTVHRGPSGSRRVGDDLALIAATLGSVLVSIAFHVRNEFAGFPESADQHPPAWFRANEIFVSAGTPAASMRPGADSFDAEFDGFHRRARLTRALQSVAQTHSLIGGWLGPLVDDDHVDLSNRVLAEARGALAPYRSQLEGQARPMRATSPDFTVRDDLTP